MRLPRFLYGQPHWLIDTVISLGALTAATALVLFLLL